MTTPTTPSLIEESLIINATLAERRRLNEIVERFKSELGSIEPVVVTFPSGECTVGLFLAQMIPAILSARSSSIATTTIANFLSQYEAFCASQETPHEPV